MRKEFWFYVILVACVLGICGGAGEAKAQFTDCSAITGMPQSECQALVDLYDSTNGANWTTKTGWKQTTTPCTWYKVTCWGGGGVRGLQTSVNNLAGIIPPSIANLTRLETLYLSGNQLTGSIPPEIGNLIDLVGLQLQANQLSGSIPPEIGQLTKLTSIYLGGNRLTGSIPPEIGNLTNLTYLGVNENALTGSIPIEIGNLKKLATLRLNNNFLTGGIPQQFGDLTAISELRFGINNLTGSIPPEIGNLTKLRTLRCEGNQLIGSIPTQLGNLTELEFLWCDSNQLTGSIPPEIGNLTHLTSLILSSNQLSGSIPMNLGNLTALTDLRLSNNQLTSVPNLGTLTKLTRLEINQNVLTVTIPTWLGNLSLLSYLDLSENSFSGEIPSQLSQLQALRNLYLFKNKLTGEIPIWLTQLPVLQYLYLYDNALTGVLPTQFANLPVLNSLKVTNNNLTGELPQALLDKDLAEFEWYQNHFLVHVSGRITDANGLGFSGATVTVTGPHQTSAVTDGDGNYLVEIPDGYAYMLTPSKTGYSFQSDKRAGTIDAELLGGLELTGQDFTATLSTYTISGTVKVEDKPLSGVSVNAGVFGIQMTNDAGTYSFSGVPYGTQLTVTPSKVGYTLTPASQAFTVTADIVYNFAATVNDADGDGLSDLDEAAHGTNLHDSDSDDDGVSDGEEVANGTNPLDRGSAQATPPKTLCAEWNGYLGMDNVLEHMNLATSGRKFTTTLYSLAGQAEAPVGFSIAGGGEYDLLVHDLSGFENNRYGQVCSTATNGQAGDLEGRMVFYKPDSATGGYQFAFAMPLGDGRTGTQYVPYNTYQPSLDPVDSGNLAANWIQLTNLSTAKQTGELVFYDRDGKESARQDVTLKAGARFDFSAHDIAGIKQVGLVEWLPTANDARFQLRNVRYYYRADGEQVPLGDDFDSAFQLEGVVGSGQLLTVPLDTAGSSAVLELANALAEEVSAEVTIYPASGSATGGEALHHQTYNLKPHATYHLIADTILNGSQGVATVKGNKPASVIATAMQYGRTETLGIQTVYGIQASEPLGTVMRGSYNTYLKQGCRLLMANPGSAEAIATVSMKRYDGTEVKYGEDFRVPAHGLTDYDLCEQDQENVYGVVTVQPATPNTIFATVLRIGESEQYRFPTPVRQ